MIVPDGFRGAAFGTSAEGDLRRTPDERARVSRALGIPAEWAWVNQVHGPVVVEARSAGELGEADGMVTLRRELPLAVAAADCVPVVIEADDAVAVVHAGWRGAAAGVVSAALDALVARGSPPRRAAVGPAIGPCCYEVGRDVAEQFPGHTTRTSWGTTSVDLPGFIRSELEGLDTWVSSECTFTSDHLFSYRRTATSRRQMAVGWLPPA